MKRRSFIATITGAAAWLLGLSGSVAKCEHEGKREPEPIHPYRKGPVFPEIQKVYCTGRMDTRYRHMVWDANGYLFHPGGDKQYVGSLEIVATTTAEVIARLQQWAPNVTDWHERDNEHSVSLIGI